MSDAPIERFFETYAERYMASDADAIAAMTRCRFSRFAKAGRSIWAIPRLSASIWSGSWRHIGTPARSRGSVLRRCAGTPRISLSRTERRAVPQRIGSVLRLPVGPGRHHALRGRRTCRGERPDLTNLSDDGALLRDFATSYLMLRGAVGVASCPVAARTRIESGPSGAFRAVTVVRLVPMPGPCSRPGARNQPVELHERTAPIIFDCYRSNRTQGARVGRESSNGVTRRWYLTNQSARCPA